MGDARGDKEREEGKGDGGMVMGIRRDLMEKGKEINVEEEGVVVGEVRRGEEKWRIVGVYVSKELDVAKSLEFGEMDGQRGGGIGIIGGRF